MSCHTRPLHITVYIPEAGRAVDRDVLMSLLIPMVLPDVVKVISSDYNGPLHLHLHDNAFEDTSSDGNLASKRTLLVNISAFDGILRCLESKTDVSVVPLDFSLLLDNLSCLLLLVLEDLRLLLVTTIVLDIHGQAVKVKKREKREASGGTGMGFGGTDSSFPSVIHSLSSFYFFDTFLL